MFIVYVIYNRAHDKIYIGFTGDLPQRLIAHNHERNKGWTKRYQPWEVVYKEAYKSKSEALRREKELKSARGRRFIREEILKEEG